MLKQTLKTLWVLLVSVGLIFPNLYGNIFDTVMFGTSSFPTSLDSLTNPSATDSVATVSHSSQHSNLNDIVEAIEAKLGIGASTAVTDSIFVGNGAGTSRFSTYATGTQAYFTNFFATGSSTLQNFSFLGGVGVRSTTTAATTTNFFSTIASTTSLYGGVINGFGLTTCSGSNFVQWTGGAFSCGANAGGASIPDISIATSTNLGYMASTTVIDAGEKIVWESSCHRGASAPDLTMGYRMVGEGATTTMLDINPTGTSNTGYGLFVATSTVTITVEADPTNDCDRGMTLFVTVYK